MSRLRRKPLRENDDWTAWLPFAGFVLVDLVVALLAVLIVLYLVGK